MAGQHRAGIVEVEPLSGDIGPKHHQVRRPQRRRKVHRAHKPAYVGEMTAAVHLDDQHQTVVLDDPDHLADPVQRSGGRGPATTERFLVKIIVNKLGLR